MRRKWLRLFALLMALSLVAAACDGDDDEDADTGDTEATTTTEAPARDTADGVLRIGSLLPSTGDLAALGPPMNQAVAMAIRDINAAGGVLGEEVVLIAEDDGTSEDVASEAADKLLGPDEVDAIVGAASSRVTLSVIDKITGAGAVECSPSNTGVNLTNYPDDGFYFRTAPPDNLQGQALADLVVADGFASVAILHLDDEYGTGFADATATALEEGGATVVTQVGYDPNGTNFEADVDEIAAAEPDAVVLIAFPDTGSTIISSMVEKGIGPADVQLYLTDGTQSSGLGTAVDPANPAVVAGAKGTAPSAAPPSGNEYFRTAFTEFAPEVDTIFSAHAYDCTVIIALAAAVAESDDPSAIRDEINGVTQTGEKCETFEACVALIDAGTDIDYDGGAGALEFVEQGEPGEGEYDLWHFSDVVTGAGEEAENEIVVDDTVAITEAPEVAPADDTGDDDTTEETEAEEEA